MKDLVSSEHGHRVHHLVLAEEVTFFNKANILEALNKIPENSKVIIDASKTRSIDYVVIEIIKNFEQHAKSKNIIVETVNLNDPVAAQEINK